MSSLSEEDFNNLPEDRPLAPLPVGETVRQALALVLANAAEIARLALLPVFIAFALTVASFAFAFGPMLRFAVLGVNLYLLVWFAGSVFRLVLLGAGREAASPLPNWRPADGRLALRGMGVLAIAMAATLPASLLFGSLGGGMGPEGPQPGVWLLGPLAVAAVTTLGLSFTLPAAAVGRGYGYKRAWREAKGALLQLFALFAILVLPVDLAIALVDFLLLQLQLATDLVVPRAAIGTAANYLSVALASSVLAFAFAKRTGWHWQAGPPLDRHSAAG